MAKRNKATPKTDEAKGTQPAAAPEEKPEKPKKPKKADYVEQFDEAAMKKLTDDGAYPFKETPADFDWAKHKPLKKKDFVDDAQFCIHRAEEHELKAKDLREEAEELKKTGGKRQKAAVKNFKRMADRMKTLRAKLEAQGMDVDALLAGEEDDEE